ncbi:hypothetical protein CSPX01_09957 [Colletotrichum filicis]|nr:hypothetical protein CSPX01_09957 [Colletotrichum filicis]
MPHAEPEATETKFPPRCLPRTADRVGRARRAAKSPIPCQPQGINVDETDTQQRTQVIKLSKLPSPAPSTHPMSQAKVQGLLLDAHQTRVAGARVNHNITIKPTAHSVSQPVIPSYGTLGTVKWKPSSRVQRAA